MHEAACRNGDLSGLSLPISTAEGSTGCQSYASTIKCCVAGDSSTSTSTTTTTAPVTTTTNNNNNNNGVTSGATTTGATTAAIAALPEGPACVGWGRTGVCVATSGDCAGNGISAWEDRVGFVEGTFVLFVKDKLLFLFVYLFDLDLFYFSNC